MRKWGERLVIAEVALALMLSIGAGLLVRSLLRLQQVDPGFDPTGVLAARLSLPDGTYDTDAKTTAFFQRLQEHIRGIPSVEGVAGVAPLALTRSGYTSDFTIAGWAAGAYGSEVTHRRITPDYFKVMRIPVLRGRTFTAADGPSGPQVVVINDALARKYFPGQDPVGKRIAFDRVPDSTSNWNTIIGVVGSEHQTKLSLAPAIEVFEPTSQSPTNGLSIVIRTSGDPASLGPAIRRAVAGARWAFGWPSALRRTTFGGSSFGTVSASSRRDSRSALQRRS
jgi:putative ABC transport system permease protein